MQAMQNHMRPKLILFIPMFGAFVAPVTSVSLLFATVFWFLF